MTPTPPRPVNQDEINAVLFRACDTFRGAVSSAQYKEYILAMLFLKYLSDTWDEHVAEYRLRYPGDEERVQRMLSRERFVLPPESHFQYLFAHREADDIGQQINIAFAGLEEANRAKLENVFRGVNFNSESILGQTKDRNRRLKNLLHDFNVPALDLRPSRIGTIDVIGNAYEYLIGYFASQAGKKGGEFYTPREVAELLATLLSPPKGSTICDPACGSGSLLIRVANHVAEHDYDLYGQEVNGETWALCRMNLFLHGVDKARIEWGDTLNNPKLLEENPRTGAQSLKKFDIVVANPPFSLDKWGAEEAAKDPFRRYTRGIPPKSKADYAFITHMVETADPKHGRVGVIVPHGVLFRGGAEKKIRQKLLEEGVIETVIGLPANLFFGTGIPAAILLLRRGRAERDVLFVDASHEFEPGKKQNRLREADIARIAGTVAARKSEPKYAHVASFDEIQENEYNLNIPRYVDTFEAEAPVDLAATQRIIADLEQELARTRTAMKKHLEALGL
jgi:type I restriction enzyme M protein